MKKALACIAVLCLMAAALSSCGSAPAPSSQPDITAEGSPATPGAGNSVEADLSAPDKESEEGPAPEDLEPAPDRLVVMDAALYRGTVTAISQEGGIYELRLEQAAGTDFGYQAITARTDENTSASFDLAGVEQGDYLEVFYGDRHEEDAVTVIAANQLPPADLCIFNGTVESWEAGEGDKSTLTVTRLGSEEKVVFHCTGETQFYLNTDDLQPGYEVNVFHTGATTRSLPAQGNALEIRPYKAQQ